MAALEDNFDLAITRSNLGKELESRRMQVLSKHGLEAWETREDEEEKKVDATGWVLYYDEENDHRYYYNSETQESLWEEEVTQEIIDSVSINETEIVSPYPKADIAPKNPPNFEQEMKMTFASPVVMRTSKAAFKVRTAARTHHCKC